MTLIFRLIIRRDIWIFHSKVFSSGDIILSFPLNREEYTVHNGTLKALFDDEARDNFLFERRSF